MSPLSSPLSASRISLAASEKASSTTSTTTFAFFRNAGPTNQTENHGLTSFFGPGLYCFVKTRCSSPAFRFWAFSGHNQGTCASQPESGLPEFQVRPQNRDGC